MEARDEKDAGCFLGRDAVAPSPGGWMQGAPNGDFFRTFRGWSRTQVPPVLSEHGRVRVVLWRFGLH